MLAVSLMVSRRYAGSVCLRCVAGIKKKLVNMDVGEADLISWNSIRCYSSESQKGNFEDKGMDGQSSNQKSLTTKERLKIITTQYGALGMAFHITISLTSLGLMYILVSSGVDFTPVMSWLGIESTKLATGASTFVVAYTIHKVLAPVRIAITFVSVPIMVKHFRKIGFFKK